MELLLPAGAPNPATFSQIVAVQDVTGDGMEDLFALADDGDTFWALTGYSGASITSFKQNGGQGWGKRDIVGVRDISKDGVPDLIFRDDSMPSRGLALRLGKPGAGGGVDLNSIGTAAASNGGQDITYATTGWDRVTLPLLRGTPDVNGDGFPDIYATSKDGNLYLFNGGGQGLQRRLGRRGRRLGHWAPGHRPRHRIVNPPTRRAPGRVSPRPGSACSRLLVERQAPDDIDQWTCAENHRGCTDPDPRPKRSPDTWGGGGGGAGPASVNHPPRVSEPPRSLAMPPAALDAGSPSPL
ncbi:FG-GAP repeat domain-containing protein [Streptomyces sp. NPDC060031]|uniref:FG-GAP repeat domain-containing protein n=1 Tax=Streptomyces sp. NPDC060031 TaxID=3347043 RepID=UPI0036C91C66